MGSAARPLRQSGIYRNLPTFDESIAGLKAVVCGATGISGFNAMRALLDTTDRWTMIYALSRKPLTEGMLNLLSESQRSRIQHVQVDLLQSIQTIADALTEVHVQADHVFFYSYIEPKADGEQRWANGAEMTKLNRSLLSNFLEALPIAGIQPRRILLQTGAKHYGVNLGRVRTPMLETDPRIDDSKNPNFYYAQEDVLFNYCERHPETQWNVVRPAVVVGATQNSQVNGFQSFAFYAAVQAQKGEMLQFGGDFDTWQGDFYHSSARMNAYLAEWMVLEDKCANQAFNAQDGVPFSYERFFDRLSVWYGAKGVECPTNEGLQSPLQFSAGKDSPLGYGPALDLPLRFMLIDWAKSPSNNLAWEELMEKHELKVNPFREDLLLYFFGDFAYLRFGTISNVKARKYGFTGCVDTLDSLFEMYTDMAQLGLLPPTLCNKP